MKTEKELIEKIISITGYIDILSDRLQTPGVDISIIKRDIKQLQSKRAVISWVID